MFRHFQQILRVNLNVTGSSPAMCTARIVQLVERKTKSVEFSIRNSAAQTEQFVRLIFVSKGVM